MKTPWLLWSSNGVPTSLPKMASFQLRGRRAGAIVQRHFGGGGSSEHIVRGHGVGAGEPGRGGIAGVHQAVEPEAGAKAQCLQELVLQRADENLEVARSRAGSADPPDRASPAPARAFRCRGFAECSSVRARRPTPSTVPMPNSMRRPLTTRPVSTEPVIKAGRDGVSATICCKLRLRDVDRVVQPRLVRGRQCPDGGILVHDDRIGRVEYRIVPVADRYAVGLVGGGGGTLSPSGKLMPATGL